MYKYDYENLRTTYAEFANPSILIKIDGKPSDGITAVTEVEIEMSAGFEASIATFTIGDVYDQENSEFKWSHLEKFLLIGSTVTIEAGYGNVFRMVFSGFIAKLGFTHQDGDIPGIRVTCMDLKGRMMANRYSRQLKAKNYRDAVDEIISNPEYSKLVGQKFIEPTPDKKGTVPQDRTIEMVGESDYEFVCKAAKKYNFDFFISGKNVYFRPAKSEKTPIMKLTPAHGMHRIDVEYDLSSQVASVEVRGLDLAKGKPIKNTQSADNKYSFKSTAKNLIKGSTMVYVDPTVETEEDAKARGAYLLEEMMYHYGTIEVETVGLPEIAPGVFIEIDSLGKGINNNYYINSVRHVYKDDAYVTIFTGMTKGIEKEGAIGV